MTLLIEVVDSPGCAKCKAAKEVTRRVASQYKGVEYRELNVLSNPERIVELGVLITPTIAMNGEIVLTKTPREEELKARVEELLKGEGDASD